MNDSHLERIPQVPPETVYLQPTGNAARFWDGEPLVGKVVKKARKYFYVAFNRATERCPVKVAFDTYTVRDENFNEGYLVYPSLEEFTAEQECLDMLKQIREGLNVPRARLSYHAVKTIYDMMVAEKVIDS